MSGADTAPSMMYVLTSVQFGQNSRNHSRTVLEHKFIYGMIYILYKCILKVISSTSSLFV